MNEINTDFEKYLFGKVKVDNICNMLVEDITKNNKIEFLNKWKLFREKFVNLEALNISKVWSALISNEKTEWFEELPFNGNCNAFHYAALKYYSKNNEYNKEIMNVCFKEMSTIAKHNVIQEMQKFRLYFIISFHEKDRIKCENSLSIIMELDTLYRSLKPQNPDKFLTYMIISQGKEVQQQSMNQSILENVFFSNVTTKLIEKLVEVDAMGANKLNNKKDSQSLNEIYHYFQKYYQYSKLEKKLPENNISIKRNKI